MPRIPKLKAVRERMLLSQQELADRAGVSRTTVVTLENERADARGSTVRKLAEALGVAPEELL